MGYPVKQSSTAQPLLFKLVLSSDHVTGATGLTPTVKISKNGGAGVTPSGAVSQVDATNLPGWYAVAGNATDTGTLGPLVLYATGSGADPADEQFSVVAYDPQVATNLGLSALPNAAPAASGGLPTVGTGNGQANLLLGVVDANLKTADPSFKYDGIAQAGAASTITLASTASAVDNAYKNSMIRTVGGTGAGQGPFRCTGYVGSTKVATVAGTFSPTPSTDTQYVIDSLQSADLCQWVDVAPLALSSQLVQATASVSLGSNAPAGWINTAAFAAGATLPRVTLADTLTTYTGNTPQTGDSYARIGANGAGLTGLAPASTALSTANYTTARAGYLDNLNVGGLVASHADVAAIPGASSTVRLITAPSYLKPASGSTSYTVTLLTTSSTTGVPTDADGASLGVGGLTTVVVNATGTDRSSNFSGWTHAATGRYEGTYAVASAATDEPLVIRVTGAVGGGAFIAVTDPTVADAFALAFNSSDRTTLNAIAAVAPAHAPTVDSSGGVAISVGTGTGQASLAAGVISATVANPLTEGLVVAGSSGASLIMSGLPTGKNYIGQAVYHYASSEKRIIYGQSFSSPNYTFTFGSVANSINGPFDSVATNDKVSVV